jgi:uncharacterized protein with PIN domain
MRLLCDTMLGRLTTFLRILGIDTSLLDTKIFEDKIEKAREEGRVFLTRDSRVLRMKNMPPYLFIKSNFPEVQLFEVLDGLRIELRGYTPFSLCLNCNTPLVMVEREEVKDKVPDYVYNTQNSFSRCPACNSIYWKGTHYERMKKFVERVYSVYQRGEDSH